MIARFLSRPPSRAARGALVLGGLVALAAGLGWFALGRDTSTPAHAATVEINVGNDWFCNSSFEDGTCVTNVDVGDTVQWNFTTSRTHTTTATSPSGEWSSGNRTGPGVMYSHTFDAEGVYQYRCNIHTTAMHGQIIVGNPATATSTPGPATATPSITPTPPQPTATLPATTTPTQEPTATDAPLPTNTPGGPAGTATEPPAATATATMPAAPSATPTRTRTATPPGGLVGDVDCNGVVNAIDAALVLQKTAGLLGALPCPQNGDVNEDGSTTAVDAALILQFSAGLLDGLPAGASSGRRFGLW